jgi:hypothetical protein
MEVNNALGYTLPSLYVFVGSCLIKHNGNFKSSYRTYMGHAFHLGEIQAMASSRCFYGGSNSCIWIFWWVTAVLGEYFLLTFFIVNLN